MEGKAPLQPAVLQQAVLKEDARGRFEAPSRRSNLLCMLPFLILFYIQLAHHQLWRDEINAWGLVAASSTFHTLLSNVHYEAHPALWYVILYPGSKLTHAPWMMKLVEACIGTAIYLVLALAAPYKRAEQLLIYSSFFILFEYTVMSRMYSLMVLATLLYVWSRVKYPDRLVQNAFWLGVIANTDVTGMILSGGLLLEYWIDSWYHQRKTGTPPLSKFVQSAAAYLGMVVLSAATLWPAKDISWRTTGHALKYVHSKSHLMYAVLNFLSLPWFPVRDIRKNFWDAKSTGHTPVYLVLAPIVVACLVVIFRRARPMLVAFAAVALVGIAFTHLVYNGSMRHFGIIYIAFLAGLWMLRGRRLFVSSAAYFLLGLNAVAGVAAAYGQWARPFCDDDAAATWIRQNHLENAALIGTPDTHVVGLPERLQRPMYFLDCACVDTYMKFSNRRDSFDEDYGVPAAVAKAVHTLHAPQMILVLNRELTDEELSGLVAASIQVVPLAQFTKGEIWDENFYLYKVSAR